MSAKTDRYTVLPVTTLLASSPNGDAVAGFTMRAPLSRCLRESGRVQRWARQAADEVLYELRVGQTKRIIKDGDKLDHAIRVLHCVATEGPARGSALLTRILAH